MHIHTQMNKHLMATLLGVALAQTACSSFYLESEVVNGPSAKVKITRSENNYMLQGLVADGGSCSNGRGFGVALLEGGGTLPKGKDEFIQRTFRAGSPLTVALRGWSTAHGDRTCSIAVTFTPEAGGDYMMTYSYADKKCHVSVYQSVTGQDMTWGMREVTDVTQNASSCYTQ